MSKSGPPDHENRWFRLGETAYFTFLLGPENAPKRDPKSYRNGAQNEQKTIKFEQSSNHFSRHFFNGFSMTFQWIFKGFLMDFQIFKWIFGGFSMVFQWILNGVVLVFWRFLAAPGVPLGFEQELCY